MLESEANWLEPLVGLSERGWRGGAEAVAIGDGALGLWKTFNKLYVDAGRQRCWVYETANVLNKREKS